MILSDVVLMTFSLPAAEVSDVLLFALPQAANTGIKAKLKIILNFFIMFKFWLIIIKFRTKFSTKILFGKKKVHNLLIVKIKVKE